MKKKLLIILITFFSFVIIFMLLPTFTFSQSCGNYAVTRTTGITYTTIAGTGASAFIWRNTASNQNDDNRSYSVPIGFDFWYLGVRYTNISASLNGVVDFSSSTSQGNTPSGSSPYGSHWSNQFSSGGANGTMLALAPLYGDLWTGNGGTDPIASSLIYKLSGSAPNRVLTIEWINFDHWNSPVNSPYASYNFQVKIYETTGIIEYDYGTMTGVAGGSYPLQYACGINNYWTPASAPTVTQLLTQQTANTTTFSNTPKNNLTTIPTSNSQITFTSATPTAAPTGLSFTAISKVGMTLNWTDNATNEVGYVIYNSTDGVNFSFATQVAANSVSAVISGIYPSTTYYWQVYAVTEGNLSTALTGTQATLPALRIISIATGNWNATATWDCTCIPTAGDSVIIADGTTVTLNSNGICYSLTTGQGVSGQLTIGNNGTARTLTVSKDVRVLTGATIITGASAASHSMSMGGNLTNNGTFNLAPTATRVCNVTFNRNGNQIISGTGATTNFNRITLNMGTTNTNALDITSSSFTVLPTNFLTLTNGTFKISTSTATLTPFTAATTLPLSTGIWINNAGATISSGNSITLYGYLRVSAGTLNIGNASNENLISYGGTIYIDGGNLNVAGSLGKFGPTILTNFTISSGQLTLATVGSGTAPFRIDEIGSTFNMSGGTIIIERPGTGNLGYVNTGGTIGTVSGGTLQMGDASTPATQTMQINASVPIYNLVVSNGVAVTAQLVTNSLTVKNNITINSGTLNANALNLTLGGNWTNTGTFTPSTGTVIFNGTGTQFINDVSAIPNFSNITINNTYPSTAITLNTPITVNGTFTLIDGHVVTDAVNILTLGANATVVTPSSRPASDSTFVKGPMINTVATTLAVTKYFPVGKDNVSHYAELNITHDAATSTIYTGEYINSSATALGWTLPASIERVSNIGNWNINKGVGANVISASVNLYYLDSYDGVTDYINLKVAKGDPNSWIDIGGTSILDGFGTPIGVSSSVNFTTFSRFSLANGLGGTNPLPVNLLSLTATCNVNNVIIKWITASETNNSYFTIEKSYDSNKFLPVATVDGAGTTTQTTLYSLTDENAFDNSNVIYYRLKQTDYDGKSSISEVVAVQCSQNVIDEFRVGTSTSEIIVYFSGNEGASYNISLFDNLGRIVSNNMLNLSDENTEYPISISSFPQGTYNLVVSSDSYIKSKQIIILK